jgi:hypothetical protein
VQLRWAAHPELVALPVRVVLVALAELAAVAVAAPALAVAVSAAVGPPAQVAVLHTAEVPVLLPDAVAAKVASMAVLVEDAADTVRGESDLQLSQRPRQLQEHW